MSSVAVRLIVVASLAVPAAVADASPASAAGSLAPVVTGVVPVQGSTVGYADIAINGRRFTNVTSVVIGGFVATRVRVLSSHRLAVSAPTHAHGPKSVVVHTSHGTSAQSKATTYTYVHATLPGSWTSSRAALPAGAGPEDYLDLVDTSCPDVSTCYSVGAIANTSDFLGNALEPGDRAVIRTRNGSSYSIVDVPLPADADMHPSDNASAEVDSIDCPAVGSCTAVGQYAATNSKAKLGYNIRVLLLTLSDGTWHAQAAPPAEKAAGPPLGASPEVSCGAPGECLASLFGDIYRLSSNTWTTVAAVVPSGTKNYGAGHVSCATASYCAFALNSSPNTYIDVLNGNQLTPVAVHAPSGTKQANYRPDVLGLQCPAAQNCVAVVGTDSADDVYTTDYLRMVGSALNNQVNHLIPTPGDLSPEAGPYGYEAEEGLFPVALECPSTTTCFTTNRYEAMGDRGVVDQSVVARLAGSTVHVFVMPEVAGTGFPRTAVVNLSCPSVTSCVAVGSRSYIAPGKVPAAAYVTFANGVWTPGSLPTVADQPSPSEGQFVDLDCPAVGHCFADADYLSEPSDSQPYARSTDLDAVLTTN